MKNNLQKLIKKEHTKIIFSFYGIVTLLSLIIPLVMLGFGIYFLVSKVNNYGILWVVVGAVAFLFALRKMKDFFPNFKYSMKPESFKAYKALVEDGIDPIIFDQELEDAKPYETLSKKVPFLMTEHLILGYNQVSFFFLRKEDVLWAYEYNGNGLVLYDKHKLYGFTFFDTVDGNDHALEELENELPYIYIGIDFDYKTIMHEEFDLTVTRLMEEREKFLADPDGYREAKAEEKREREEAEARRLEEEAKRLEEEKNEALKEIDPEGETSEEAPQEEAPQEESVLSSSVLDELDEGKEE